MAINDWATQDLVEKLNNSRLLNLEMKIVLFLIAIMKFLLCDFNY